MTILKNSLFRLISIKISSGTIHARFFQGGLMKNNKNTSGTSNLSEEQYAEFERKLLSRSTSVSELERICMTLAHSPSKESQDILARFKESRMGKKVEWLDIAIDEGQFVYLEPRNEREERDYLALKMVQEMSDQLVDLEIDMNEAKLDLEKMEIEHGAIRELINHKKIDEKEGLPLHDIELIFESRFENLREEFELKEKIVDQILQSITTPRYQNLDPDLMRHIHFI
jgi:hypothetical protein